MSKHLLFALLLSGMPLGHAEDGLRLPPPLIAPEQRFGQTLAFVDTQTLAIGVPGLNRVDVHAANHPSLGQWGRRTTLTDADARGLGQTLAAGENGMLAVGAPDSDDETGVVLVYRRIQGEWRLVARLRPAGASPGDRFGAALAFQGPRLLVGAPGGTVAGHGGAGRVYLFRMDGDRVVALGTWQDPFPETGAGFGSAIAADGQWTAIGVPGKDAVLFQEQVVPANGVAARHFAIARGDAPFCGTDAGAVYLYPAAADGAHPTVTFAPQDAECGDRFGARLAIATPWLAVGTPNKSVGDFFLSGQTYLYRLQEDRTWKGIDILGLKAPDENRRFGAAVALVDDRLIVGAPGQSQPRFHTGAVLTYRLHQGHWHPEKTFTPSGAVASAGWGESVAAAPGRLAVGAPRRDCGVAAAGMVALPEVPAPPPGARFDFTSGILSVEGVTIPDGRTYRATLRLNADGLFVLETAAPNEDARVQLGRYHSDGRLHLPWVAVNFAGGGHRRYSAWLQRRPSHTGFQFQLLNVCP